MPHNAEQSLAIDVSVRNKFSGLFIVSRFVISVLEGMCLPDFCLFCVIRISSSSGPFLVVVLGGKECN